MSKVARGGIHFIIIQVVGLLTGVLLQRVLALILSPTGYGAYGLVVSFTVIVSTVVTAGIPSAASRYLATNPGKEMELKSRFLGIQGRLTIIVFVAYLIAAPFVVSFLLPVGQELVIIIAACYIPIEAINILYFNFLNGLKEYHKQGNARLVYFTTKAFFAISLVILGYQLFGAMIGFVLGSGFSLAIEYFYWTRATGEVLKEDVEIEEDFLSKVMLFSVPLIIYSTLNLVLTNIDVFIINAFMGHYDSGIFFAAKNIAQLPYQVLIAAAAAIFPAMATVHESQNREDFQLYAKMTLRYLFLVILPCIMFMVAFSQDLILLIYDVEYLQGNLTLQFLSVAYMLGVGTSFTMTLLISTGHTKDIVGAIVIAIVSHFIGCFLLIPIIGILGAGISWVFASLVLFACISGILTKREGRIIPGFALGKGIIGLGIAVAGYLLLYAFNMYISFIIAMGIYLAFIVISKALTLDDIKFLLKSVL